MRAFTIHDRWLISVSLSEGRIILLDYASEEILLDLRLPANCDSGYDLSPAADRLITVYSYERISGADVWELSTGKQVGQLCLSQPHSVVMSDDGAYALVSCVSGSYAWDLVDKTRLKLPYCSHVSRGDFTNDGQRFLVPTGRKGLLYTISFAPLKWEPIKLPINRQVVYVKRRPGRDHFAVTDSRGESVRLLETACLIEKQRLRIPAGDYGLPVFSGDGSLLGVECYKGKLVSFIVVDLEHAKCIGEVEGRRGSFCSFIGPSVLSCDGAVINLRTGEVDDKLSQVRWWRSKGL